MDILSAIKKETKNFDSELSNKNTQTGQITV